MILCQLFKGATPAQTTQTGSFSLFQPWHGSQTLSYNESIEAHSTTDDHHQLYKDTQRLKKTSCIFLSSQQQLPTGQHPASDQGEW